MTENNFGEVKYPPQYYGFRVSFPGEEARQLKETGQLDVSNSAFNEDGEVIRVNIGEGNDRLGKIKIEGEKKTLMLIGD